MFDLEGYFPSLMEGLVVTISLSFFSLFIAMALGIIGALAKLSSYKVPQKSAGAYTTLVRGVPELVLMLLIFFGGQMMVNQLAEMVGYEEDGVTPASIRLNWMIPVLIKEIQSLRQRVYDLENP